MDKEIVQITSGRGPAECCWVVAQVLKVFLRETKKQGLSARVLEKVDGDINSTLVSAIVSVEGKTVVLHNWLSTWEGSILWIGHSEFRKMHKRKNWFIGFHRINKNDRSAIKEKLIQYTAMRSGGPGGQHVNKVSSAIRAVYKPLGLSVVVSESRSQNQNKKLARSRLLELVAKKNNETELDSIKSNWNQHNTLERGNPIRTFVGKDFKSEYKNKASGGRRKKEKQALRKQLE
ncbi:MAG: peptide chain release factor H [Crocinitomicaceae bacterium]|nr:peptide chain release factor H [Crocinitomicaceae bacterium]|tara:strand:- start:34091 stop:34789 length:699 start_codon:yes stop_codon:yes gene_type:complete